MPKKYIAIFLAVAAFALGSLAFGATYLGALLPGGLPLGNALTAIGLCAIAAAAAGLSKRGTALRTVAAVSLLVAAAWLPISVLLAGNLALNFSDWRGDAWTAFSLAALVLALFALLWALLAALLAWHKSAGSHALNPSARRRRASESRPHG